MGFRTFTNIHLIIERRNAEDRQIEYIVYKICGNGNHRARKLQQMAAIINCCYQSKIVRTLCQVQTIRHLWKNFIITGRKT